MCASATTICVSILTRQAALISPGLDRALRKPRDFEREHGKQVDVTLYAPFDGKKQWTGTLAGCDGKTLILDEGTEIPMEQVSQIRLHIDF